MTHLLAYIQETRTKQSAFAEQLGVSRSYLSELVGGSKRPSLNLAFAIERLTEGAVKASDWEAPAPDARP